MKKSVLRAAALVIALITAVFCISSCGNGSAITEEIETCPIPEGMTFDELCGMLSVYGHRVTLPCTMDDITALDDRISRDPKYSAQFVLSTNREASLVYSPSSGVNGSSYFETVMLWARDETYKKDLFAVCGIKFGSDISEIQKLLGEPVSVTSSGVFEGSNYHYAYIGGDAALRLWFVGNADNELCMVQLMYTKWTKV
jgi:hypothetical protein